MNNNNKTSRITDPLILAKYKEYFKSFVKFKKNNNMHKTFINSMYLQFRDKYQKFVTNNKNSFGLKFKGNKIYENLPLNIFRDNYILNTCNISKELENKVLEYFFPLDQKELSPEKEKEIDGEKIKLTPIPYKNDILINTEEERNRIQEAKRSAVLMRRVEYTHLIKKNKSSTKINNKRNKKKDELNWNDKIYILKGAVIMIEDWWKEIKEKKKQKGNTSKKNKGKVRGKINLNYISDMNRKKNERYKNVNSNEIRPKKMKLIQSNSCNKIKIRNTNVFKKPSKLNIENTYTIKSNNNDNIKTNLKLSSNNINKSTALNSNVLNSYKPLKSTEKNTNRGILIKVKENEIDENKNILSQGKNYNNNKNKINSTTRLKRKKKKLTNKNKKMNNINKENNTNNNNINNNKETIDISNSINIDSINKIKAKIYNALTKKDDILRKRNLKYLKNSNTYNNKSTNDRTNKNKNINSKECKEPINNIKMENNLKKKNPTEFVYDFNDIIQINNSLNNAKEKKNKNKNKKNKAKKMKKKPELELHLKTNYDVDRKDAILNGGEIIIPKSTEIKRINDLDKIVLGNNYNNTDDINNMELNLFENNKEENNNINNKKIKYVESKENDILILGLNNEKNNIIDENNVNENNVNVIKEINIKFNDINDNLIINNTKDTSKIKENIAQNVDNFNIEDKSLDNKINNSIENNNHNNNNIKEISKIDDENNNIGENNLLKSVIKKYRSYSFNSNNDRKKRDINISENNKSRDDNDIIKESSNKFPKIYDIFKNEEFYINKNDNNNIKKNQIENLIENNQNLFIANAK